MGEALRKLGWRRSSYIVSTKFFWGLNDGPNEKNTLNRKYLMQAIDASLARFGLDYVDLVFCHRADPDTPIEETVYAMHDMIAAGKALYWGTSEWSAAEIMAAWQIAERHHLHKPVMEQPQYNLLHRERVEEEYARLYGDIGLGTTIWSPLASGLLTGKYNDGIPPDSRGTVKGYEWLAERLSEPAKIAVVKRLVPIAADFGCTLAQMSLAWCLKNPHVSTVITGASRPAQVVENMSALDVVPKLDARRHGAGSTPRSRANSLQAAASAARPADISSRIMSNPLESWNEEQRSALLYRACADAEADNPRAELFRRLAGEAEAQAAIWRAQLTARGHPAPAPYVPDARTRLVMALVQKLGPRRMQHDAGRDESPRDGHLRSLGPGRLRPRVAARRRRRRAPASRPARRRQPARGGVRRQRRTRVEREPHPGRRRREPGRARRAAHRNRRHVRRRLRDGHRRIRFGALAARALRVPDRTRARRARPVSGSRGAGARAHLRREGTAARRGVEARDAESSPTPSTRSTRWRARSSASTPTSWARHGARRSRRSFRSQSERCCRSRRSWRCRARARSRSRSAITALALFAVGALLSLFTGRGALRSGLRMLVLGGLAGAVTFAVGRLAGVALG